MNLKNAYPVTDEVGAHSKPFRFKLTNTCGVGVNYNINLEVMESEGRIASKNIAVKVDENEKNILSDNAVATPIYKESDYTGVESYTVGKGELKPYNSTIHEVRIWLDESAGNDSQNGTFYSKVIIEAIQNQKTAISLADYLIDESYIDEAIEEFTHETTSQTPALIDYRYTGSDPNNYVYFGCKEEDCTEENLYQIIGVIPTQSEIDGKYENRVKLIKADYYEETESGYLTADWKGSNPQMNPSGYGYYWNNTYNNKWETNTLNTKVLNGTYWNSLGEYQKYIDLAVWYLGASNGNLYTTNTSDDYYNAERSNTRGSSGGELSTVANIGLFYPSDFGYSLGKEYANKSVYENQSLFFNKNWSGWITQNIDNSSEHCISPESSGKSGSMTYIGACGVAGANHIAVLIFDLVYHNNQPSYHRMRMIRPTFYLKTNVLYKDGVGSKDNPYRITIIDE